MSDEVPCDGWPIGSPCDLPAIGSDINGHCGCVLHAPRFSLQCQADLYLDTVEGGAPARWVGESQGLDCSRFCRSTDCDPCLMPGLEDPPLALAWALFGSTPIACAFGQRSDDERPNLRDVLPLRAPARVNAARQVHQQGPLRPRLACLSDGRADGSCEHHQQDKMRAATVFCLKRAAELAAKDQRGEASSAEVSELARRQKWLRQHGSLRLPYPTR